MEFRGRRRKEERERKCWELRVNSDEGIFGFSKAIVSNNCPGGLCVMCWARYSFFRPF